jgi:poly-beta-1,6-N-acetyl-D-glucosamine N-deacetylase
MRELIFLLLRLTGLPFLLRELVQRRRVSILCYHDPKPDVFERHLRWLARHYHFISLAQYLAWRETSTASLPRKALIVTLDDGHRGNYRLKHLFSRYAVRPTLFVCSEIVGTRRHFWWKHVGAGERERLKRLSDGARREALMRQGFSEIRQYDEPQALTTGEIGELKVVADVQSHTRFHPILPTCSDERAAEEIRMSKLEIEQRFGAAVDAFAYPNGDYCARDVAEVHAAGYRCALTIDGGYNTRRTDPFLLCRIRMADDADLNEVVVKASGLWGLYDLIRSAGRRSRAREWSTGGGAYVSSHAGLR